MQDAGCRMQIECEAGVLVLHFSFCIFIAPACFHPNMLIY
jgi:hypothetical protein